MGHKATIECDKVRQSFRLYHHGATEYVQEQLQLDKFRHCFDSSTIPAAFSLTLDLNLLLLLVAKRLSLSNCPSNDG